MDVRQPAAEIDPGERAGKFRTGSDQLLADADGRSHISMEDYAIAFIDNGDANAH